MTNEAFDALRAAVTYARNSPVDIKLAQVRTRLSILGFSDEVISEALEAWAEYAQRKQHPDD
ncbi:hypothetical protein [Achromobacter xylosoxidans]|uniref:hypothetical protein n=1 Tax=Alcaligenes xylosoxydans xylosoxydans TaxID=85698 RepID=UPI001F130621|nr:hypothetical protein [Achromobacter xylosoxidans]